MDRAFVGRGRELDLLSGLLERAGAGDGCGALVAGEAGIGKSALLGEILGRARAAGLTVLLARAGPDDGAPAFWPWTRLLAHPDARSLGLHPELLAAQGPGPADPGEPAAAARFRAVARCVDALRDAARQGPLVVAVEDAHWADAASARLLGQLWAEVDGTALLVLATARTPLPAAVADLAALPSVHRFDLRALGPADVAALLGPQADPTWPAVLHRHTGGNPLFLRELARLLDEQALRAPATSVPPAPVELHRVIGRRIGALSPACRELLAAAAAYGEEVDVRLLPAGGEAVAEAVGAEVLVEDPAEPGRLRWSHPVVRATWYDGLARAERVRWHGHLAAALEAAGTGGPADVARHRLRAAVDAASRTAAVAACVAAARDAAVRRAFDEAGGWLRAAYNLLDAPSDRAENLLEQARAAFRDGQVTTALELAEAVTTAAESLGRPDLAAAAATVVTGVQGPSSGSVAALCARARALLGDEVSARQAHVLAQHAIAYADGPDPSRADELSRRAWEMAGPTDDPDALLAAARARLLLSGRPDEVHDRLALAARLRAVAAAADRPDLALWAHLWRIDGALMVGAVAEADGELFALAQLVDRVGWPLARWHLLRARASRALLVGRFAEAEALALEFRQVALATQDRSAHGLFHAFIEQVQVETGRFADHPADPALLAVADGMPIFHAAWGFFRAAAGDLDAARHQFERLRPALPELPTYARWPMTVHYAARLAVALGDLEVGAWCYAALEPYGDYYLNMSPGCSGAVNTTLGLLATASGRHDDAVARLSAAVTMERRIGALPFLARAQLAQARARAARGQAGDREAATRLLDECLDIARRLGQAPVVAQAEALAAEVRGLAAGPAALTAREREIAGLVAAGRSNREIADALVISERTVETHVRNLLAKLGLANRTQVASWAVRELRTGSTYQH